MSPRQLSRCGSHSIYIAPEGVQFAHVFRLHPVLTTALLCCTQVVRLIYAATGPYKLIDRTGQNYVGYIAKRQVPAADGGGVDVAILYRGTITLDDWIQV